MNQIVYLLQQVKNKLKKFFLRFYGAKRVFFLTLINALLLKPKKS